METTNTISIQIQLGAVEAATCTVDQPQGHNAAEMLAESRHRLETLLVHQHAALPSWANDDAALAHEIGLALRSIQIMAATPPNRCVS